MRKIGKIIAFTPYEEVKDKNGETVVSKKDGLVVMKRQVVVDCSRINEYGEEVKEGYVCDMYNDVEDSKLELLKETGEKVALYIFADYSQGTDGKYYQRISLKKIKEIGA